MADEPAWVREITEFAAQQLDALDLSRLQDPELFQAESLLSMVRFATVAPPEALDDVLHHLVPILFQAEPLQACRLALAAGVLVENGGGPGIAVATLADRLRALLPLALEYVNALETRGYEGPGEAPAADVEVLAAQLPDAYRAWRGLPFLGRAVMTMLARDVQARRALLEDDALYNGLKALSGVSTEAYCLEQALLMLDSDLIVLHPGLRRGYRVQVRGISNCFWLFSALQAALVGPEAEGLLPGEPTSPEMKAVLSGEPAVEGVADTAAFHYYQWPALQWDYSLDGYWIWGENSPLSIGEFRGLPLVLLGPKELGSRAWGSEFCSRIHEAHEAGVELLRILPPDEVDQLIADVRDAAEAHRARGTQQS